MTKISTKTRNIIRQAAEARDAKYRITSAGEVHFYGQMPNTNADGWYFAAWTPSELVTMVERGQF